MFPELPKNIWSYIRSFSGPNEPTPTAQLMKFVKYYNDHNGLVQFPHCDRDGYASSVFYTIGGVRFLKPCQKCRDTNCTIRYFDQSCEKSKKDTQIQYLRLAHVDSEGYFIRAPKHPFGYQEINPGRLPQVSELVL